MLNFLQAKTNVSRVYCSDLRVYHIHVCCCRKMEIARVFVIVFGFLSCSCTQAAPLFGHDDGFVLSYKDNIEQFLIDSEYTHDEVRTLF